MKVWNKEVSSCLQCVNFLNNPDRFGCTYLDKDFEYFEEDEEIYKDCPFNRPLTKEDIESFGFVPTSDYGDYGEFIKKYRDLTSRKLLYNADTKICDIEKFWVKDHSSKTLFSGSIVSKPHLEFILQSLNII